MARVLRAWAWNPNRSNLVAASSIREASLRRIPDARCGQVLLDGLASAGNERSDLLPSSQHLQMLDLQGRGMEPVVREELPAELDVLVDQPTGVREASAHGEQRGR